MKIVNKIRFARMWPREVFDCLVSDETSSRRGKLAKGLDILNEPGVYVLYRDDVPYYVGQGSTLFTRLAKHACFPGARYGNFWNYFSAFVVEDQKHRDEIEGILIAAMPTANSAKPKLERKPFPKPVADMVRKIRHYRANPVISSPH